MKVNDRPRISGGQRTAKVDHAREGGVLWLAGRKHEIVKPGHILHAAKA
jgi:hypothetical protein